MLARARVIHIAQTGIRPRRRAALRPARVGLQIRRKQTLRMYMCALQTGPQNHPVTSAGRVALVL